MFRLPVVLRGRSHIKQSPHRLVTVGGRNHTERRCSVTDMDIWTPILFTIDDQRLAEANISGKFVDSEIEPHSR